MGFSIKASVQCDLCGKAKQSSDEECDHGSQQPAAQLFRGRNGREPIVVYATTGHMWTVLEEAVGDDWLGYDYIGPRSWVITAVGGVWPTVDDMPHKQHSAEASP